MTSMFQFLVKAQTALAALAVSMAAAPVLAQEAQPQEPQADNGDIIVTAQFRSQRLQDTPIAITATSGETLAAKAVNSITDLTSTAPNVNLSSATGLNGSAVNAYIRGIGQNESSFALEPGVGIYIDDVYYGTTFGAVLDLNDLDRVEVLRGPQGTLAGKNSIGGAVKLFSKKPDASDDGFVQVSTGSYGRIDVRASAGFTIADGLYARISGVEKHTDGYMALLDFGCVNPGQGIAANKTGNCKIGAEGGIDVKGIRGALRYAPADSRLEINLIGDYSKNDSEQVATKLIYANNPAARSYVAGDPGGGVPFDSRFITGAHSYTSYADYKSGGNFTALGFYPFQVAPGGFTSSPKSTAESWGVQGTIDYQLSNNLSLKSITAYRKATGGTGMDIDGSPLQILLEEFDYLHKQFTQELRLGGKVGSFADFTVGGYYYNANDRVGARINIPLVLFDFVQNDPVKNKSSSAFAHVELHPTSNLNVIGGIRYTHDEKTYTFYRRNPDGTLPSGVPLTTNFLVAGLDGLVGKYKGNRVDYRIGLNYRFSPALMVYAQLSTGYKGGGINPRPFAADQVLPFNSETLTAWEAGFKSDLLDRRVRLNGAAFYNIYKNIQITRFNCAGISVSATCSMPVNSGDAHVWGLEGEAAVEPVDGLTIDGSFGYLNFRYTRVDSATTLVTLSDEAPFNPSWQASTGIQYKADLGNAGSLTPRLDWNYQSSFYFNAVNNAQNKVDARGLLNLRLTYTNSDRNWEVATGVTNLFDKFYYLGKSENVIPFGLNSGAVGRPREWYLSVKRKF